MALALTWAFGSNRKFSSHYLILSSDYSYSYIFLFSSALQSPCFKAKSSSRPRQKNNTITRDQCLRM